MIRLYHGYISLKMQPTKHGNNLNQRKTCYGLCQCRELSFLCMVIPPGQPNDSCCHHLTGTPLKVQAAFLPCITLDTCSAYRVAMSGPGVAHEWPMGLQSGPNWSALLHLLHLPDSKQLSWPQRLSTLAQIVLTSLSRANAKSEGRCTDVPHVLRTKIKCKAPTIGSTDINWYQLPFLRPHITLNSLLGGWSSQHRWRMCGAQLKMLAPTHLPHRWPSKRRSLEALWGAVTNRHKRRKKIPVGPLG